MRLATSQNWSGHKNKPACCVLVIVLALAFGTDNFEIFPHCVGDV